jgi:D-glycero-D-manno-heptose 1,7-bisphosphate phosphatase
MLNPNNKIVLLDRDGVINQDSDSYIKSADEWRPIPGSLEAMAQLHKSGYKIFVVTNQSGLGRGLFAPKDLVAMHDKMQSLLANFGGKIKDIVFCPHHPDEHCQCRKPAVGLLQQLQAKHNLNFENVPFVGDTLKDLGCAAAMGARGILVLTGKGEKTLATIQQNPKDGPHRISPPIYSNLAEAVKDWLNT